MAFSFGESFNEELEVMSEQDGEIEYIVLRYPSYLMNKARKPFQARELSAPDKDGYTHEIPKSVNHVWLTKKKGDYQIAVTVNKRVQAEQRLAAYQAAVSAGHKVRPLTKDHAEAVEFRNGSAEADGAEMLAQSKKRRSL